MLLGECPFICVNTMVVRPCVHTVVFFVFFYGHLGLGPALDLQVVIEDRCNNELLFLIISSLSTHCQV